MGLHAKPSLSRGRARAGIALPAAIFGVVVVSLLAGGALVLTTRNMPLAENREENARAVQLAEAAASHALAALRSNALKHTPYNTLLNDASILGAYISTTGENFVTSTVPLTNGTYFATIINDPADPDPLVDTNEHIVIRCTGVTRTGATAVINALVGPTQMPAFAANGDVFLPSGPSSGSILGPCGSIHANGNLSATSGLTVEGEYSATGTASGSQVQHPDGTPVQLESGADPVLIPSITYAEYCPADANYVLQSNGFILDVATGTTTNANGSGALGWRAGNAGGSVTFTQNGTISGGTYCVEGNVTVPGSPGPMSISIVAQGSINISGTPQFTSPAHPDGLLFFAGGDVSIGGNVSTQYTGSIYARGQCEIGGTPNVNGSILCYNETTVSPATNLASSNRINGNVNITYDCTGMFTKIRKFIGWYQTLN